MGSEDGARKPVCSDYGLVISLVKLVMVYTCRHRHMPVVPWYYSTQEPSVAVDSDCGRGPPARGGEPLSDSDICLLSQLQLTAKLVRSLLTAKSAQCHEKPRVKRYVSLTLEPFKTTRLKAKPVDGVRRDADILILAETCGCALLNS